MLYEKPTWFTFLDQDLMFFENAPGSLSDSCEHRQSSFTLSTKALLGRGYGCGKKEKREWLIIGDIFEILLAESLIGKKFIDWYTDASGSPIFYYYWRFHRHKTKLNGQLWSTSNQQTSKVFHNILTAQKPLSWKWVHLPSMLIEWALPLYSTFTGWRENRLSS